MIRWVALLVVLFPVLSRAQTNASLLFNVWKDKATVESEGEFLLFQPSRLDADNSSAAVAEASASGRWRLMTDYEINPSIGYDWTHFEIGGDHRLLPGQLDDGSLSIASPLGKSGDWFAAALAGFGYAGDNSFGNSNAWYGMGEFMVGRAFSNGDALLVILDYNGNRTLMPDVPLPAIEYSGHYGKNLDYTAGFPVNSVGWRITDDLRFSLAWLVTTDFDIRLEYDVTPHVQLFSRYTNTEYAFRVDDMKYTRRMFLQEQRIEAGAKWTIARSFSFVGAVGYGFGRTFSMGFDDRTTDEVTTLSDEPYLRAGLELHF